MPKAHANRAGQGWQAKESAVRLAGWSRQRRIIVLRRRVKGALAAYGARARPAATVFPRDRPRR